VFWYIYMLRLVYDFSCLTFLFVLLP